MPRPKSHAGTTKNVISSVTNSNISRVIDNNQHIARIEFELDPNRLKPWKYANRHKENIEEVALEKLASDMQENGQRYPIEARPIKKNDAVSKPIDHISQIVKRSSTTDFEIITGRRRWLAAMKKGLKLRVFIEYIDDQEASLRQHSENEQRKDLTDYEKGDSYKQLLENKVFKTQSALADSFKINKNDISRYLSYDRIPEKVSQHLNFYKISARTAECIAKYSSKGKTYQDALISIASQINKGAGEKIISSKIDRYISPTVSIPGKPLKISGNVIGKFKSSANKFSFSLEGKAKNNISFESKDIAKIEKVLSDIIKTKVSELELK